jgi:hypothetical protein
MDFDSYLAEVRAALNSINMQMEDWQRAWPFDFRAQFERGIAPGEAAEAANRFWWYQQNKSIGQACRKTENCWLPQNHRGECQLV